MYYWQILSSFFSFFYNWKKSPLYEIDDYYTDPPETRSFLIPDNERQ